MLGTSYTFSHLVFLKKAILIFRRGGDTYLKFIQFTPDTLGYEVGTIGVFNVGLKKLLWMPVPKSECLSPGCACVSACF